MSIKALALRHLSEQFSVNDNIMLLALAECSIEPHSTMPYGKGTMRLFDPSKIDGSKIAAAIVKVKKSIDDEKRLKLLAKNVTTTPSTNKPGFYDRVEAALKVIQENQARIESMLVRGQNTSQ